MSSSPLRIVVLVKSVPDAQFTRSLDSSHHLVRQENILSELDEYAIEAAVQLREADPERKTTITALTVGPADAAAALRKSLQLGADEAFHVNDDALAGSDAAATSRVIAAALTKLGSDAGAADLILCGMASTDGESSIVPAQLAERLELPQITFAASLALDGDTVKATRTTGADAEELEADLPALVSVTDQANNPRYPNFKAIMAAKKKPLTTWSLSDVGLEPSDVGVDGSWTAIREASERPQRSAGVVITDEGDGGVQLVDFLAERKLL